MGNLERGKKSRLSPLTPRFWRIGQTFWINKVEKIRFEALSLQPSWRILQRRAYGRNLYLKKCNLQEICVSSEDPFVKLLREALLDLLSMPQVKSVTLEAYELQYQHSLTRFLIGNNHIESLNLLLTQTDENKRNESYWNYLF